MRTINIHAREFYYKTTKRALKSTTDPPGEYSAKNALVVFTCIERGDNDEIVQRAVEDIIKHAKTVKADEIIVYPYAHLSSNLEAPRKAASLLAKFVELLNNNGWKAVRAPFGWYKEFKINAAGHPLAELSRTFSPEEKKESQRKLGILMEDGSGKLTEYLDRFGFKFEEGIIKISYPWKMLLEGHSNINQKDFCILSGHYLPHEVKGECALYATLYILRGEKEYEIQDIAFPGNGDDKLLENLEVASHNNVLWVRTKGFRASIGIRLDERTLLFHNAFTIALIADRLKDIERGETPILPLKYSPIQAGIIELGEDMEEYISEVIRTVRKAGLIRIHIEQKAKIGDSLRWLGRRWVPIIIIVGPREKETRTIVVRTRKTGDQRVIGINELEEYIKRLIRSEEKHAPEAQGSMKK